MTLNYQIIIDMIADLGIIVFPISLLLCLSDKIVDTFLSFVSGKRVRI